MVKNYILLICFGFCCFTDSLSAQTTTIPDSSFEKLLIETSIDSDGIINEEVITSELEKITRLSINYDFNDHTTNFAEIFIATLDNPNGNTSTYEIGRINSLIGIEDFSNLTSLFCSYFELTSIDVSNNINLTHLGLTFNDIETLDLSKNTKLEFLELDLQNYIKTIDVSSNIELRHFQCSYGAIEELDLSNNLKLEYVNTLYSFNLTKLNVANGNNDILAKVDTYENATLQCIQVDDEVASNNGKSPYNNWRKDEPTIYSEDCQAALDVDDEILNNSISLFPNPVNDIFSIESNLIAITKVEIYAITGKKLKEVNSNFFDVNIKNLSSGLYLTKIYSEKGATIRKIIKI